MATQRPRRPGVWRCCDSAKRFFSRVSPSSQPTKVAQYHPIYEIPAQSSIMYGSMAHAPASAMSTAVYLPKGHIKRGRRSWAKFQSWVPPGSEAAA